MPVDARIPLQVQQPQFMTPYEAESGAQTIRQQMQSTQLNQQKLAAGQHELRNQMLLAQVAAVPGSVDPATGLWSQAAIDSIVKTNPMLGRDILQKQTKDQMAIEQLSLEKTKGVAEMHKLKSTAINDEQIDAIAAADAAAPEKRDEVYAAKWTEAQARLKKTGLFAADTNFADMTYKQAKEISLRRGAKEEKNPVREIAAARDTINELKTEYSHMDPKSPQAAQIMEKIRDGEAALSRMKALPGNENEPSDVRTAKWLVANKNNPELLKAFKDGQSSDDPVGKTASSLFQSWTSKDEWPSEIKNASADEKIAYARKISSALHNKEATEKPKSLPTVKDKASFDKLKKGDRFIDGRTGAESVKG